MAVTNLKPAQAHGVDDLLNTIRDMDALSKEGFSQIAAIASLALLAMKQPGLNETESVIQALRAIRGKAQDIESCINSEAELVGGNHVDIDRRELLIASAKRGAEILAV